LRKIAIDKEQIKILFFFLNPLLIKDFYWMIKNTISITCFVLHLQDIHIQL